MVRGLEMYNTVNMYSVIWVYNWSHLSSETFVASHAAKFYRQGAFALLLPTPGPRLCATRYSWDLGLTSFVSMDTSARRFGTKARWTLLLAHWKHVLFIVHFVWTLKKLRFFFQGNDKAEMQCSLHFFLLFPPPWDLRRSQKLCMDMPLALFKRGRCVLRY